MIEFLEKFKDLIIPFFSALTLAAASVPFTIKLAQKFKLLDDPQKRPHPAHIQQRVIPRAGGLPLYIGIILPLLFVIPLDKHILGIILGMTVLLVVGLLDDYLRDFSPFPRLAVQFIAAGIVVLSGVGISFITNPMGGILRLDQIIIPINILGQHNIVLLADILAFIWIVWLMNIVNWAKGVDGQMPGIITIAAIAIGLLSYKLFTQGDINQLYIAQMSFITAGATLGFLFFNWHPAKIIPGFSASTILGFIIATLSILSGSKLATALLVLLIPTIDFLYTFFRRILNKKSPFLGDQKHLHHLLLKKGWSHQKITLFYISSCIILGLLAVNLPNQSKVFTGFVLGTITLGSILWLHLFNQGIVSTKENITKNDKIKK